MTRNDDPDGVLAWIEEKTAQVTGIPVAHGEVRVTLWPPSGEALQNPSGAWQEGVARSPHHGRQSRLTLGCVCWQTIRPGMYTCMSRRPHASRAHVGLYHEAPSHLA